MSSAISTFRPRSSPSPSPRSSRSQASLPSSSNASTSTLKTSSAGTAACGKCARANADADANSSAAICCWSPWIVWVCREGTRGVSAPMLGTSRRGQLQSDLPTPRLTVREDEPDLRAAPSAQESASFVPARRAQTVALTPPSMTVLSICHAAVRDQGESEAVCASSWRSSSRREGRQAPCCCAPACPRPARGRRPSQPSLGRTRGRRRRVWDVSARRSTASVPAEEGKQARSATRLWRRDEGGARESRAARRTFLTGRRTTIVLSPSTVTPRSRWPAGAGSS